MDPVVVTVERSGLVESVHLGNAVVTAGNGQIVESWGEVDTPMYPRSSLKPLQAIGMLRGGLGLSGSLLALAAASHSGEEFHRAGVETILQEVGLDLTTLQNTPDTPMDAESRNEWIRQGKGPESVAQNCSGKHAAMVRTACALEVPIDTYLDQQHPVQRLLQTTIAELAQTKINHIGVDGCGAPLFAIELANLAAAFGRIAAATAGWEYQVAQAFREYPEYASGTKRDEAALHRALPGVVAKAGAEAVYALGLPDGRGFAVKIIDGAARAATPLLAALLQRHGVDHEIVRDQADGMVWGHGKRVGSIQAQLPTRR